MTWTDDRVETLTKLWNDGITASAIAQAIGEVTRNAVIGKVHRLGLAGRASGPRKRRVLRVPSLFPVRAPSQNIRSQPRLHRTWQPHIDTAPRRAALLPELGPPPDRLITVQTLTELTCRWPLGDPKMDGFHFCGRPKQPSGPYCGHHAALAYR